LLDRDPSIQVALLEQAICGHGASGRNGGFVSGYWRYLPKLMEMFGAQGALDIATAGATAQTAIRQFVESTGADVWWKDTSHLKVATLNSDMRKLHAVVDAAGQLGQPEQASILTGTEVVNHCRSETFLGGALFAEGAMVQPARLARLLRDQLIQRGGRVYEHTTVQSVDEGRPMRVRTPKGSVTAQHLVLATNSALSTVKPVQRSVTPFSSHIALTEPVPEVLHDHGWESGIGVFDSMMFPHYFRTTPDGRIAMGSGSGGIGRYGRVENSQFIDDAATGRAIGGLRRMFPGTQGFISHAWGGPIDVSADGLPFFGSLHGRVHFGAGYSGHGVNPTWIGGQILASLVLESKDEWTDSLFCTRPVPGFPPEPARTWGAHAIQHAIINVEEAHQNNRRPRVIDLGVAAVPRLLRMPLGTR